MRRLCLFFLLCSLPLGAQTSLDNSASVSPPPAPKPQDIAPVPDMDSASISTNIMMAAEPIIQPKIDHLRVSPGTVREGFVYREGAKTIVTLNVPATKPLVCHVVSSDPDKLACGAVSFGTGDQEQTGLLEIKWKNIDHDCQIGITVYDPNHPEIILHSRLYLRKAITAEN
jgi:hypothetical protein